MSTFLHRVIPHSDVSVCGQMSEPAFDQLRTKEQLGYIVFTGLKRLNQQYLALHMIVQSSHKDADYLDGRVESFLLQVVFAWTISLRCLCMQDSYLFYIVDFKLKSVSCTR